MKLFHVSVLLIVAFLSIFLPQVNAGVRGQLGTKSGIAQGSQIVLDDFGASSEYPILNLFKNANNWSHGDNSAMLPDEIDANGWPLPGKAWTTHSGASILVTTPSQSDRQGHYVLTWTGQASVSIFYNGSGSQTLASCTAGAGLQSGFQTECDNTACSSFTGSISGTTLTVTAAPTGTGCSLGSGVPITGSGVTISKFGTPTIITSAGSVCGGNTCYTVNQSQTVGSITMQAGARLEWSIVTPYITNQGDVYTFKIISTGSGSNYAQNFALFHVADESAYLSSATPCAGSFGQACITSGIFQTRIKQANFGVMRDLNYMAEVISNCSSWATRRPINYYSYGAANEFRNAASGPGQYVNASGTGASGGTISYNAGTDTYSITLGSGNFQDKQTFSWLPPTTGTSSSKVSLNGNTAVPVLTSFGSSSGTPTPTAGFVVTSVYDATLAGLLSDNNQNGGAGRGLICPVPPEIFIEINAELNTTPWHVLPFLGMDPMTDWAKQYATYVKTNYPQTKPIFEVTNEPNNFITAVSCYLSLKSKAYAAIDSAWNVGGGIFCGTSGNVAEEVGKMASTAGQDILSVYGAGNYELLGPTMPYLGNSTQDASMFTSDAYVAQTLIPVQSGYTQTAAYNYETGLSSNNYWNLGYSSVGGVNNGPRLRGIEASLAYCYYNYSISASCQGSYASQAAVMTQYFSSSTGLLPSATNPAGNVTGTLAALQPFITAAASCFTFAARPAGCKINQVTPMRFYEGGYAPNPVPTNTSNGAALFTDNNGDLLQPIIGASNATQAVLTIGTANDGCVTGETVGLSLLTGGTWSGSAGNYTVQSATATTCTINLNSTGLGTFGSATTTAAASWAAGATSFAVASCTGIAANQNIGDATTGKFVGYVSSCSGTTLNLATTIDAVGALNAGSNSDTLVFSTALITYKNSFTYVSFLRNLSYTAPELDAATVSLYSGLVGQSGIGPSQFLMGSESLGFVSGAPWYVFATDVYGFYPVGQCTACTITSTTLTLGGTITGQFRIGDTLVGGGSITGKATGAGSNTTMTSCTPIGSNVCGTTAGDTLGLSQASTVSSGQSMMGTIPAPANNAANGTTSPVRAWGAICRFNGNGSQCNG